MATVAEAVRTGLWHQAAGRLEEAEQIYRQVLAVEPRQVDALHLLGVAIHQAGRHEEGLQHIREAIATAPEQPLLHCSLAQVLSVLGRSEDAQAACREALRLRPDFAEAHLSLGNILHSRGELAGAEAAFREALRLGPDNPDVHNNLGNVLRSLGRGELAEGYYREALRLRPADAVFLANLGGVLRDRSDLPAARAAFAEAVRLRPTAFEVRNDLAACLIEEGQTEEAVVQLQEVLRLRPGHVPALGNLGTLARDGLYQFRDEDTAQVCDRLADPALPAEQRSALSFTLAHVLHRRQAYDEAFSYYRQANDTKAELFRARGQEFDRASHLRFVEQMIEVGTAEFFRNAGALGNETELPVFIVGMPRSGTTLVEQILASHPRVYGAGELSDIPELGKALGHSEGYPTCLKGVDATKIRAAAAEQLARLSRLGGAAGRVTDKLPANAFHLPLIRLLFPRAFIIHCVRDPIDVCVSCYFQDFYSLSFATRLDDIGFYHRTYERLTEHWRAVLPPPVLEVRYEELVADPEGMSRRLIAFCGLDWDDRCLRFHENRRVVRTSSVAQVRQPIYRSAVGRWQHYRRHLGPLLEALGRDPATA